MIELKPCPNCGALTNGEKCDYCGTIFEKSKGQTEQVITFFADNKPMLRTSVTVKEAVEALKQMNI